MPPDRFCGREVSVYGYTLTNFDGYGIFSEKWRDIMMEKITAEMLVDKGICPTCYDRTHDLCVFGDTSEQSLYKNDLFECLLISNPRTPGHAIITTMDHYKDMMELPDDLCREVYAFARRVMIALKEVYHAESVYLCTMCDGPMNHFHVQMLPRYAYERRGSRNFLRETRRICA